jgi:hypothetical protein
MTRTIPMVFMVLLAIISATSYYCTAQSSVSAASSRVVWSTGSDAIAKIDANGRPEIFLSGLEPNATTVYTDALKFTLLSQSVLDQMKIEIAFMIDSHGIIWGIRFYVFKSGTSTTTLTLVDGSSVPIDNTDGAAAVCAVGYRQSDACLGYGKTTTPVDSKAFTGADSAAYTIAVEVYGKDGILSTQGVMLQLELIWF